MSEATDRPAIASAVIVKDGRVLLARRREREGSLLWVLPGGEVETGESAEEAAAREAFEETGLAVEPRRVLGERVHPKSGRQMVYVACDVVTGTARVADADELDAVEWVEIGRTGEYVPYGFFDAVQAHLDAALVG